MTVTPEKSKLVIDLDSCDGIFIKQDGEEYPLKDFIYKLVLLAIIREREETSELKKAEMRENIKTANDIMRLFGFKFEEDNES